MSRALPFRTVVLFCGHTINSDIYYNRTFF